ncbi:hypothetical protein [Carnobacterium divergens]|uniref:hypothetical protein n=1 Tax=Carnobacterium divergens TaxID=2748 RepID=UPI001071E851|nr:hypothetical protein [Carnobacterium divergens]TFI70779.1 hypothetical protein CKN81_11475 [Carnobacterium divergens]
MSDLLIGIVGLTVFFGIFIIGVVAYVKLLMWVYYDANARNMNGTLIVILVMLFQLIPGLLVYLVLRKPIRNFGYQNSRNSQLWKSSLKYYGILGVCLLMASLISVFAMMK